MAFKLQTVTSNFSNDFIFYAVRQVAEAAKMLLRGAGVSGATILRVLGSEQWIQMKCRRDCCRKQTSLEGLCFEQLLFSTNSNKFVCVPNIYFNFIQIMFSICVTNDNRIMIYYGLKKNLSDTCIQGCWIFGWILYWSNVSNFYPSWLVLDFSLKSIWNFDFTINWNAFFLSAFGNYELNFKSCLVLLKAHW